MEKNSYDLFFNRDELRSRSRAKKPEIYYKNGVSAIFPIDPDGSGTWIFINNKGVSAALLNFNIRLKVKNYKSRGTLLRDICFEDSINKMLKSIYKKNLENYRGFTLCLFEQNKPPGLYRWNGTNLAPLSESQPIISSSVKLEVVKINRKDLYRKMLNDRGNTRETHLSFHCSHSPEKSYLSTCMHREDAKTVSFSHIFCNRKKIVFNYKGKSPCTNEVTTEKTLIR